jgi:predicted ATPase
VYYPSVIRRLYVHNYRCLENFELSLADQPSALLIGKNGSGKTTVGCALEVLQRIARGTNRVGDLVKLKDMGRTDVPMRFELEAAVGAGSFRYSVAFEFPAAGLKELRIVEERLSAGTTPLYWREFEQVHLDGTGFFLDEHLVALPIIKHPARPVVYKIQEWLGRMLILRPMPSLITGDSEGDTQWPNPTVDNFGAWFSGLLGSSPSAYTTIDQYLRQVMPDFRDIKNPPMGGEFRRLFVQFSVKDKGTLTLPFEDLADGEKCFMICALVLAASERFGPLVCFWDEPDNYLAPSEVGHLVVALRKAFQSGGQFVATSHNTEAIASFSDENTFKLFRNSHLEPTIIRSVKEARASGDFSGNLVDAVVRGDV